MAIGDDAAAAGYALVAPTDLVLNGPTEFNRSRDYIAQLKTQTATDLSGKAPAAHTHTSADITDATASATANTVAKRNASGQISVGEPTAASHAATRGYVQSQVGGGSGGADGPSGAAYNRSATGSGQYAVWMNSALQFMRNVSSKRFKKDIRDLPAALDGVLALRPVTYLSRDKTDPDRHVGFIAEEVADLFPEAVSFEDGKPYGIEYSFLVVPLVKALQEQQQLIDQQTLAIRSFLKGQQDGTP